MLLKNHLPENLSFLRESAELKQADIQNRLGIVRNTWSNWENRRSEPGIDNLLKIAHFFDMDVGKLITEDLSQVEGLEVNIPDENEPLVHEADYPGDSCGECVVKERIINVQKETIKALQGQVDVLQLFLPKDQKTSKNKAEKETKNKAEKENN